MTVLFGSPVVDEFPRKLTDFECPECARKMSVFVGTNCLVCECGSLRWLV